jgi:hypothetical protein
VAAEVGNDVILGCDAHTPEGMNHPQSVQQAKAMVKALGMNLLETAQLRSIHR